jgi:hypothetical protein
MFIHEENIYNRKAAQEVVPFLIKTFNPSSVLDVGCGKGTWLNVFSQFSTVCKIRGIDGLYVDVKNLDIPSDSFISQDLNQAFDLGHKYDLLICLEVAEHLECNAANAFIESITRHSDIIVFSAAIPGQGGQKHINEQWPEYWQQKFSQKGFDAFDILRNVFWDNVNVNWWYKQNMFVYIKRGSQLHSFDKVNGNILSYIHPELFKAQEEYMSELIKDNSSKFINQSVKECFLNLNTTLIKKIKSFR